LSATGEIVAAGARPDSTGASSGAGGGRGMGVVVHRANVAPPAGAVLVTPTLDPALASWLPRLGGLVAETGSTLSHLAILAREMHVPTVVGVDAALERFPEGTTVVVDGRTGEIRVLGEEEAA
jgi:pyruvate,water dikinase